MQKQTSSKMLPPTFSLPRVPNLIILVAILVAVLVGLAQVNRLLQELPAQHLSTLDKHFNKSNSLLDGLRVLERSQSALNIAVKRTQNQSEIILERLNAMETSLENSERLRSSLEEKLNELQKAALIFKQQLSFSVQFLPLKDADETKDRGDHVWHYFMSVLRGRGFVEGPPELFSFPSGLSQDRLLCFKGNNSTDGERNFYAFAFKDGLPVDAELLPGTTLISDTFWDFNNPWHAMYNLIQFVQWKMHGQCAAAARLVLFHRGEYRKEMGEWISRVMKAVELPSTVYFVDNNEKPICFENAVVSRSGIGGMRKELLLEMFTEARCQARRSCQISAAVREPVSVVDQRRVNITLVVRSGGRRFIDESAWIEVVRQQCQSIEGCSWSVMYVSNLTFCQQVEKMSYTDILVSAHGAQLTNMIFMSPGGRVMEMFPAGWLDLAGHGQYIYKHLATWVGLNHEGYWRDPETPLCPHVGQETFDCFISHYKDQPLGINTSYIGNWLSSVIADFHHTAPIHAPDSCSC